MKRREKIAVFRFDGEIRLHEWMKNVEASFKYVGIKEEFHKAQISIKECMEGLMQNWALDWLDINCNIKYIFIIFKDVLGDKSFMERMRII